MLKHPKSARPVKDDLAVGPRFGMDDVTICRHELLPGELSPDDAYQIIHDELMLDGNPRLNTATFITTWKVTGPLAPIGASRQFRR